MRTALLKQADAIVEAINDKWVNNDYYKYDRKSFESESQSSFPYIWIVREGGTELISLGKTQERFLSDPTYRYRVWRNDTCEQAYFRYYAEYPGVRWYLVVHNELLRVTFEQVQNAYSDYITPPIKMYEKHIEANLTRFKKQIRLKGWRVEQWKSFFRCKELNSSSFRSILTQIQQQYQNDWSDVVEIQAPNWWILQRPIKEVSKHIKFQFTNFVNGRERLSGTIRPHITQDGEIYWESNT